MPAGEVLSVDLVGNSPATLHNLAVNSSLPVAVERVIDYTVGPSPFTTVQSGARLAAETWHLPAGIGPSGSIIVMNSTGADNTVSVKSMGPAGPQPVAGYESVPMKAGAVVILPLGDKGVNGRPLIIEGATPIIVERLVTDPAGTRRHSVCR